MPLDPTRPTNFPHCKGFKKGMDSWEGECHSYLARDPLVELGKDNIARKLCVGHHHCS